MSADEVDMSINKKLYQSNSQEKYLQMAEKKYRQDKRKAQIENYHEIVGRNVYVQRLRNDDRM